MTNPEDDGQIMSHSDFSELEKAQMRNYHINPNHINAREQLAAKLAATYAREERSQVQTERRDRQQGMRTIRKLLLFSI